MNYDVDNLINEGWIKACGLIVNLYSMEKGFREEERHRQEIWDHIQYREGLLIWPSINKEMRESS